MISTVLNELLKEMTQPMNLHHCSRSITEHSHSASVVHSMKRRCSVENHASGQHNTTLPWSFARRAHDALIGSGRQALYIGFAALIRNHGFSGNSQDYHHILIRDVVLVSPWGTGVRPVSSVQFSQVFGGRFL
jgi:hypothetical protein